MFHNAFPRKLPAVAVAWPFGAKGSLGGGWLPGLLVHIFGPGWPGLGPVPLGSPVTVARANASSPIPMKWGIRHRTLLLQKGAAADSLTLTLIGYYHGMAPASELPGIPMTIPMVIPIRWPQPLSYQVFLWLFLWGRRLPLGY